MSQKKNIPENGAGILFWFLEERDLDTQKVE